MKATFLEVRFKTAMVIIVLGCFLFSSGCAHQIIQKDFDPTKKIQVIPVTKIDYIYAQNDFLLNSTLEKELSKMSSDWNKEVKDFKFNTSVSNIGLTLQFLTLVGCLVASDTDVGLAWCGSSIASAFLITFPFAKKAKRIRHNYITDYNAKFN